MSNLPPSASSASSPVQEHPQSLGPDSSLKEFEKQAKRFEQTRRAPALKEKDGKRIKVAHAPVQEPPVQMIPLAPGSLFELVPGHKYPKWYLDSLKEFDKQAKEFDQEHEALQKEIAELQRELNVAREDLEEDKRWLEEHSKEMAELREDIEEEEIAWENTKRFMGRVFVAMAAASVAPPQAEFPDQSRRDESSPRQ